MLFYQKLKKLINQVYFYKAQFQMILMINGLIILFVVPRALGPELYGKYSYVLSTAMFFIQSLLAGLTPAYVHYLNDPKQNTIETSKKFVSLFMLIFSVILLMVGVTITNQTLLNFFGFNSISNTAIILIMLLCFLKFLEERAIQLSDICNTTLHSEILRFKWRTSFSLILSILWFCNLLSLQIFLTLNIICWLGFLVYVRPPLKLSGTMTTPDWLMFLKTVMNYSWKIYAFLFLGALYVYLGRFYLAQNANFNEQSKFYAGYQLGTFILPIISAYTALIMKKFSTNFFEKNILEMKKLFYKFNISILIAVGIVNSLLYYLSYEIINIVFGEEYLDSVLIFNIILIFTWLQAPGIVNSNFFASTERTGTLSIIQVVTFVGGIVFISIIYAQGNVSPIILAYTLVGTYFLKLFLMLIVNIRYLSKNL